MRYQQLALMSIYGRHQFRRVDLVKIDIEGREAAVFEGAPQTLQKYSPSVLFEITNEESATLINWLISDMDYSLFNIDEKAGLIKTHSVERARR